MAKREDVSEGEAPPTGSDEKTDAQRITELTESLARVQADYANYRRRTEEQGELLRQRASERVVRDLLGVLDNLELALRGVPEAERGDLYQGVEMILGQLVSVLEEHGAEQVPTESFDPRLHEAILSEASGEPKGSILEVLQQGYLLGGQVLRTAKVKVSLGPDGSKAEDRQDS